MQYFFILGRNPELSRAELHALLPDGYTVVAYSPRVLIVECAALDISALVKRLGGTIKAGEILPFRHFAQASRASAWRNLTPLILQVVRSLDFARDDAMRQKLFLGLSAYALDKKVKLPSVRELRELGIEIKRGLQEQGYKVRLVTSKEVALSSVIVKKERLLRQGAELVLCYKKNSVILGRTIAVQEFEEASARDYGRPERSMGVGMLPVQLAKTMINLARIPISGGKASGGPEALPPTILDPFCGLGTVLMEALQMGYKNIIGSDIEQKMIDATRKNLNWVSKLPPLRVRGGEEGLRAVHNPPQPSLNLREGVTLITTPVEQLSQHLPPQSVDAIVTEPYMGPVRGIMNYESGIMDDLVNLYIAAFHEFSKILKPGGRVVFIFPAFKTGSPQAKTSGRVLPEIKKIGFEPINLLPANLATRYTLHATRSITYSRPDQRVLREIFVLEFKR